MVKWILFVTCLLMLAVSFLLVPGASAWVAQQRGYAASRNGLTLRAGQVLTFTQSGKMFLRPQTDCYAASCEGKAPPPITNCGVGGSSNEIKDTQIIYDRTNNDDHVAGLELHHSVLNVGYCGTWWTNMYIIDTRYVVTIQGEEVVGTHYQEGGWPNNCTDQFPCHISTYNHNQSTKMTQGIVGDTYHGFADGAVSWENHNDTFITNTRSFVQAFGM